MRSQLRNRLPKCIRSAHDGLGGGRGNRVPALFEVSNFRSKQMVNVELWGFEPQTSCMPWGTLTFDVTTGQMLTSVRLIKPGDYDSYHGQITVKVTIAPLRSITDQTVRRLR